MINLIEEKNFIKTIIETHNGQILTTTEIKKAIEEKNNCTILNITRLGRALKEIFGKKKFYRGVGKYTIRPVVIDNTIKNNDIENKITITIREKYINIRVKDSVGKYRDIIIGKKYL